MPPSLRRVVQEERDERGLRANEEDRGRVGRPGYTAPDPSILSDSVAALALGKNVLLKGPTGAGKTRLAEHLSYLFGQPTQSINCSVDLDVEALLGFKTLVSEGSETSIQFVPGPVVTAMERGHLLYIDEINMAKAETLPILNGVLDHRHSVFNPFTGKVVKAAAGFRVIAAINIGYIGTVPLNEALKNRFVVIDVPHVQGDKLYALLLGKSRLADPSAVQRFVGLSADLLQQVVAGQLPDEAASVRALLDACDLATAMPPLRAVQRAIADKLEDQRDQVIVKNIAETWFADDLGWVQNA